MIRTITTLALSAILLAGCGGGSEDDATPAKAAATEPATTTPTPEATTPAEPTVLSLGDEVNLTAIKATVLEYKQNVPPEATADEGSQWDAVNVKVCNESLDADLAPVVFSWQSWQLDDGDGGRFDPSNTRYRQFPAPDFADDEAIAVGQCSKGWVVFDVPAGTKLSQANLVVGDEQQASWSLQ